ncbi:MAG: biotin--[acetyl-CoA-carboxylase] ligase [Proteobacteria bacterium]|nr:biotin--[acetyl-CoA-carboxylase] ligase [Pseudomonadota bacterium]
MAFKPTLHYHPVLPSTMDEARRLAEENASEGAVVQAGVQTAGRGRFGNQWASPEGNLYMTLLLRPPVATRFCAQLSFAIAVALAETLEGQGVPREAVKLKWPNDVLVDGRKIAGILLEMESGQNDAPAFLLAGIGVNVAVAPEGATHVQAYAKQAVLESFRDALVQNIGGLYDHWIKRGYAEIRARWLSQAYGMGQPVTARMAERKAEGIFEGIDAEGNLILSDGAGVTRTIHSGAVHFRMP